VCAGHFLTDCKELRCVEFIETKESEKESVEKRGIASKAKENENQGIVKRNCRGKLSLTSFRRPCFAVVYISCND